MREGPWVAVHNKYGFSFVAKARSFKIICKSKRRLLWWPASATTTQFLSAGHLTEEVIILTTITNQTFPERTKGRTPQPTLRVWSEARDVCQQQGPTAFTGLTLLRHRNQTLPRLCPSRLSLMRHGWPLFCASGLVGGGSLARDCVPVARDLHLSTTFHWEPSI